ncbi:MAG: hypothetical protein WAZ18_01740 [Alphaproteobacteria bacterium]
MSTPMLELPKLADTRSTQRLLNILSQLEESTANRSSLATSVENGVVDMKVEGEIARLRRENKALKANMKQALERIDALMEAMTRESHTQPAESMAA